MPPLARCSKYHNEYFGWTRAILCNVTACIVHSEIFSSFGRAFREFGCFVGYGGSFASYFICCNRKDLYLNNNLVKLCLFMVCSCFSFLYIFLAWIDFASTKVKVYSDNRLSEENIFGNAFWVLMSYIYGCILIWL